MSKIEDQLDELLAECVADPLRYVMSIMPWTHDETIQSVKLPAAYRARFNSDFGPDLWACEFLDQLGVDIRSRAFNGRDAVDPIQYCVASGHGIGKSVMVAWLVKFIMDTRPFCRGTVTANTADQLKSKTWAEVGKWHSKSLTHHRFHYSSGRGSMSLVHKEYPKEWFTNAQTCREENSEAFAGQHAANSTSFYVFDEASAVPRKIYEVRGGGLTDGEPMTFDFGNPTRNSGDFFENCVGNMSHRYRPWTIDSRSVAISNKSYIDRLIADYGIDSDYVKVRVLGLFPEAGNVQFISSYDVEMATQREATHDRHAPLLIGVDVARNGGDESVIKARVGYDARSWPAKRFRGLDTVQLTGKVIETVNEFRAIGIRVSGLFIDSTGLGAGVFDQLRHLGYDPMECHNAGGATDKQTYSRKGDEAWGDMRDAIKTKLILPAKGDAEHADLVTQLTSREYGYTKGDQIKLEPKDVMRERGVGSPDLADALALTFFAEVANAGANSMYPTGAPLMQVHEYDPMERY